MFRHVSSQRTLLMLHPIPSCFSSLYFNYWAFETILHLVLCVKLAIVVVCIITHFASCRTILIWFQERADFSVQECWSGSQVNFGIDIGQIMLWADQTFPEYHTFLVKNRVCQVLQHVKKSLKLAIGQLNGSTSIKSAWLTGLRGGHFGFACLSTNCSIKWLSADKFHVLLTSCKIR